MPDPWWRSSTRGEAAHRLCLDLLDRLTAPLLTTWPAFTEAVYLLGAAGGWRAQDGVWKLTERGDLQIVEIDEPMRHRIRKLMAKYRDVPMDLADASLVAAAEALHLKRVFTLDSDFHVYRFRDRQAFEVVP